MIGFGELRKKSVEWQTEISTVEKIYARDWLLRAIFERDPLRQALSLRGESAFASAYFPQYPRVEDLEFTRAAALSEESLSHEIEQAANDAAGASTLKFRLSSMKSTEARVEFTGPLGRRSAAQPLLVARFVSVPLRLESQTLSLLHPFSDPFDAQVRAVSLVELAAERIVLYSRSPRARDLFDLWFILTHAGASLDPNAVLALVQLITQEKKVTLRRELDAKYAAILERGWDNSLKGLRARPPFSQVRFQIAEYLAQINV